MPSGFRAHLTRFRGLVFRDAPPRLADETRWYTEHTALLISTLKWAMLGAAAGICVGLGTRVFLWALARSADWAKLLAPGRLPVFIFLPLALPLCVWIIRTFASDARFRYYQAGDDTSRTTAPALSDIRGLEMDLTTEGQRKPAGTTSYTQNKMVTSVFFKNVRAYGW